MLILTPQSTRPVEAETLATVGMFDGVHAGHRHLLRGLTARAAGMGCASAVVTFLNHPLEVVDSERCPAMLTTASERLRLLESTGVDYCLLLEFTPELMGMSAREFVGFLGSRLNLRGIVAGYNNRLGRKDSGDIADACREAGIDFHRADGLLVDGEEVSSSVIRGLLRRAEVARAATLLNRLYRIEGTVAHGREIGRTIGFPTANIVPVDPLKLVPARGVYACVAWIDGCDSRPYAAMVNIGLNPTVSSARSESIEVHLIGFDSGSSLYGHTLTLCFVDYMRAEKRFDSLDELRRRLEADRVEALERLGKSRVFKIR